MSEIDKPTPNRTKQSELDKTPAASDVTESIGGAILRPQSKALREVLAQRSEPDKPKERVKTSRNTLEKDPQVDEGLAGLFAKQKQLMKEKGQGIFSREDESENMCLLEDGFIVSCAPTAQGEEKIQHFYKPGEIFPLQENFNGILEQQKTYFDAFTTVKYRLLSQSTFKEKLAADPKLALSYVEHMQTRLNSFAERINILEQTYAGEKVIYQLAALLRTFGERQEEGYAITVPISAQTMANLLNVTRETASVQITKLKRKGIISYNGRKESGLLIRDLDALIELI